MLTAAQLLAQDFATMPDLIRAHAKERPSHIAVIDGDRRLTNAEFDALVDRVAASLQRDGIANRGAVAMCGPSSIEYVAVFVAAVRIGAAACPLAPSSTPEQLAAMVRDCAAGLLFVDDSASRALDTVAEKLTVQRIALEGSQNTSFASWLAPEGAKPTPVEIDPNQPFNI